MKTKAYNRSNRAMFWGFMGVVIMWVIMNLMYIPRAYGETEYPDLDKVNEMSTENMAKAYTDLCKRGNLVDKALCLRTQRISLESVEKIITLADNLKMNDTIETITKCVNENIAPQGVIDWVKSLRCISNKK